MTTRRLTLLALTAVALALPGATACKKAAPSQPARKAAAAARPAKPSDPAERIAPEQIESHVFGIVAVQMGVKRTDLTRASRLKDDLKADDLDTIELTMELEDTFRLSIPDEHADRFRTVGDLVDYVRTNYIPAPSYP